MFDTDFMERYGISDKYHNLPSDIQNARLRLMNRVIDTGCTINKDEAIKICGDESLYKTLLEKEIITRNEVSKYREEVRNSPKYKPTLEAIKQEKDAFIAAKQNPEEYLRALFRAKMDGKIK